VCRVELGELKDPGAALCLGFERIIDAGARLLREDCENLLLRMELRCYANNDTEAFRTLLEEPGVGTGAGTQNQNFEPDSILHTGCGQLGQRSATVCQVADDALEAEDRAAGAAFVAENRSCSELKSLVECVTAGALSQCAWCRARRECMPTAAAAGGACRSDDWCALPFIQGPFQMGWGLNNQLMSLASNLDMARQSNAVLVLSKIFSLPTNLAERSRELAVEFRNVFNVSAFIDTTRDHVCVIDGPQLPLRFRRLCLPTQRSDRSGIAWCAYQDRNAWLPAMRAGNLSVLAARLGVRSFNNSGIRVPPNERFHRYYLSSQTVSRHAAMIRAENVLDVVHSARGSWPWLDIQPHFGLPRVMSGQTLQRAFMDGLVPAEPIMRAADVVRASAVTATVGAAPSPYVRVRVRDCPPAELRIRPYACADHEQAAKSLAQEWIHATRRTAFFVDGLPFGIICEGERRRNSAHGRVRRPQLASSQRRGNEKGPGTRERAHRGRLPYMLDAQTPLALLWRSLAVGGRYLLPSTLVQYQQRYHQATAGAA
jgi:hypothetical protein